jgi:hypothetical protein
MEVFVLDRSRCQGCANGEAAVDAVWCQLCANDGFLKIDSEVGSGEADSWIRCSNVGLRDCDLGNGRTDEKVYKVTAGDVTFICELLGV